MLQKYIVAEICNFKKDYKFRETNLQFDKNISSLLLTDDYVQKDIDHNTCFMYSVFESMIKSGIYSSISSILRAIKNGVLTADLIIVYTANLNHLYITDGWYMMKDSNSLKSMLKYMTSVQYSYSFKTKEIRRFELYGDPILGDDIERPICKLVNDLDKDDILSLDNDRVVNTYGLSRELGECYNIGTRIKLDKYVDDWEIHINPSLTTENVYFQLYDFSRITEVIHSHSTKCARISLFSPQYIHCSDCSKEEWILTNDEKESLCRILTDNIWEKIKSEYCNRMMFASEDMINKIKSLPMPDYSRLK